MRPAPGASPSGCGGWRSNRYPICPPKYKEQKDKVNPYVFMEALSEELPDEAFVIPDCGGNLIWTMQGLRLRGRFTLLQRDKYHPWHSRQRRKLAQAQ